jgi:iron complex outermembrane recepter protein
MISGHRHPRLIAHSIVHSVLLVNGLCISVANAQGEAPPAAPEQPPEADTPQTPEVDIAPEASSNPAPEAPVDAAPSQPPAPPQPPAPEAPTAASPEAPVTAEEFSDADFKEFSEGNPFEQEEGEAIIVTVDRRKKDIQKVSSSVQSISGDDLSRKGVTSVRELTASTPYVEIGAQEGNIEIYMRGVGNSNNTEIGDPATAPHIDGIYIPRPRGFGTMFFDVERVEINRGPQGTVRGRNAAAGTINIVTKAPKPGEWEAEGNFQLGNYNQRLAKGVVNVPIGDKFALRFAAFTERRDPYYTNKGGDPEIRAAEDADTWAYRLSGRWVPTDNVTVTVRFDNTKERGTGWVGSNYTDILLNGLDPSEVPDPRAVAYVGHQPSQSLDHWGVSADIEVDFGPVGLQVLSSYRDLAYRQNTGTTNGVFYNGLNTGNLDRYTTAFWYTTSQSYVNEIRLFAPDTSRFRWSAGFFHFMEEQYVFLGGVEDKQWGWMGQEFNHPDVPSSSIAGYVDATFDITETFRALGGFRFTNESKARDGIGGGFTFSCDGSVMDDAGNPACNPAEEARYGTEGFRFKQDGRTDYREGTDARSRVETYLDGIESFGARDEFPDLIYDANGELREGIDVGGAFREQHGKVSANFPDFRVGLEWDVKPANMLYLTFTTGHKSGGFNDTVYAESAAPFSPTFGPEALYATELGSKNVLLDKKLVWNASAFWYMYNDYQTNNVRQYERASNATVSVRENAGDARILGLESDVLAHLPQGFNARASISLLDARFLGADVVDTRVSWDPAEQDDNRVNLEDNFLPRAPQLGLAYGIEQNIPTEIGYFDWSFSGQTKSKMYMTQFNGEGFDLRGNKNPVFSDVIPWTTRLDASIGYTRSEGNIRVDAFVSNITNMTYMTSLINTPNLNLRFFNPPRMMGVRMSMFL